MENGTAVSYSITVYDAAGNATGDGRQIINAWVSLSVLDRLVGLVVKASASRAKGPGFKSRLRRDFFGVESYQ